jgi:hypothetical protein
MKRTIGEALQKFKKAFFKGIAALDSSELNQSKLCKLISVKKSRSFRYKMRTSTVKIVGGVESVWGEISCQVGGLYRLIRINLSKKRKTSQYLIGLAEKRIDTIDI